MGQVDELHDAVDTTALAAAVAQHEQDSKSQGWNALGDDDPMWTAAATLLVAEEMPKRLRDIGAPQHTIDLVSAAVAAFAEAVAQRRNELIEASYRSNDA